MSTIPVHTLDVRWMGQEKAIACYALETDAGVVLIDPGPHSTHAVLRDELLGKGIELEDIRHVVVTHIHLDHAGGAWWWARHGGTASHPTQVTVHDFGARHLVDPSRLNASATRIYGDQMEPMWGELQAIPEIQVRPARDGDVVSFGNVSIRAVETPGHAAHHHGWEAELNDERVCFCGDAAAMTVQGRRYVSLPMPPPEYHLDTWLHSLERLRAQEYDALYPTHYGRVDDVVRQLDDVGAALRAHTSFLVDRIEAGLQQEALVEVYGEWVRAGADRAGLTDDEIRRHVSFSLVTMNVMGVSRYHQQRLAELGSAED